MADDARPAGLAGADSGRRAAAGGGPALSVGAAATAVSAEVGAASSPAGVAEGAAVARSVPAAPVAPPLLDRLNGPLHLAVALAGVWLLASSPWIGMYDRLPQPAGWANLAHAAVGFAALLAGAVYAAGCAQGGRWRQYFPWAGGDIGAVGRDVTGLVRGRLPTVEDGGLLPLIEGLLLLALLAAAATGAAWFFVQGTEAAAALREQHIVAARALGVLLALHLVGVALHLLDFVRD